MYPIRGIYMPRKKETLCLISTQTDFEKAKKSIKREYPSATDFKLVDRKGNITKICFKAVPKIR
jgi:hypothetical protein